MNEEEEVRRQLKEVLQNDSNNYKRILELSSKLASFDNNEVRFSIDAGIIDRLGSELVARQETAVSELVKNAYDADASEVILTFIDSNELGGVLNIKDNGDGMSREELIDGFMRISSTDKIHNPYSKIFKRKRAGQKGIGRFAVQRLGSTLTIITQTENAESALKLTINWESYKKDKDLASITNRLETINKIREKGTTLIIGGLKDKWTQAAVQRIYRYVNDIIQPFPLSKERNEEEITRKSTTEDPGFKASFIKVTDGISKTVADDSIMIYEHASAIIDGMVDDEGKAEYNLNSEKLDIHEGGMIGFDPDEPKSTFKYLKNVWFRAYYYIYDTKLIPAMHYNSIQALLRSKGGIRLYRNGFRVLPYGEPGNDWLSLDKSSRQRTLLPAHASINFFGLVELTDENLTFQETSSREGLKEDDAFIELQNFVYRTIITGVVKVAENRNVKITTSQKKDEEGIWEKIEFRIKNIAHTIEELDAEIDSDNSIETKKKRKRKIKQIKKEVKELEELQKVELDKMIKEKSMLRVLSSVGLNIAQFVHEIKYYLNNIKSDLRFLLSESSQNSEVVERIQILDSNFSTFQTYTSYFDKIVSQNVIRQLRPQNLQHIVNPFVNSIEKDAIKSGIEFSTPIFSSSFLFTKPMHPSEWSSILFNFYTNAKKAIKQIRNYGKILIECGETDAMVYLEFSDTGVGISKENEEKIFDEFFTTTAPEDFESLTLNTEILGTGLGLKIVKDIVNSYKGNVFVASSKGEYNTCIRVEIPKASEKDLEKYGL